MYVFVLGNNDSIWSGGGKNVWHYWWGKTMLIQLLQWRKYCVQNDDPLLLVCERHDMALDKRQIYSDPPTSFQNLILGWSRDQWTVFIYIKSSCRWYYVDMIFWWVVRRKCCETPCIRKVIKSRWYLLSVVYRVIFSENIICKQLKH